MGRHRPRAVSAPPGLTSSPARPPREGPEGPESCGLPRGPQITRSRLPPAGQLRPVGVPRQGVHGLLVARERHHVFARLEVPDPDEPRHPPVASHRPPGWKATATTEPWWPVRCGGPSRAEVPEDDGGVPPDRREPAALRVAREPIHGSGVLLEPAHGPPVRRSTDRSRRRCRRSGGSGPRAEDSDQIFPSWASISRRRAPVLAVPEADGPVVAPRGDEVANRGPRDRVEALLVALELSEDLAGRASWIRALPSVPPVRSRSPFGPKARAETQGTPRSLRGIRTWARTSLPSASQRRSERSAEPAARMASAGLNERQRTIPFVRRTPRASRARAAPRPDPGRDPGRDPGQDPGHVRRPLPRARRRRRRPSRRGR